MIELLDTGVQINVMTENVMGDVGLAITKEPEMELVSHNQNFFRLFEEGKVIVEDHQTCHLIFFVYH